MPQVPYNPVPSVEPTSPGEKISVNTPGAAFGENIGAALQHLGATGEQVGNELFTRAIALQDLRNENEAREADAKYAQLQSKMHADYSSKEGKDAVDGLDPYIKQSGDLRTSIRNSLSSPVAQRMYDSTSVGFLQRNIFNAAGHAADQNKHYSLDTIDAQHTTNLNGVRQNPDSDAQFEQTLQGGIDAAHQTSVIKGEPEDSPQAKLRVAQSISQAWAHRILGKNDTDPDSAARMLEDHKDSLEDQDYAQVEARVKSQSRGISSTNIANETMEWGKGEEGVTPPKTIAEMVAHAKELAQERHPDDPMVAQHAVTTLHGLANTQDWEAKKQRWSDTQTVEAAIAGGDVQNIQQLRAMPDMQAVLGRLGPKYENDLPKRINNLNNTRNQETNHQNYLRIEGLFNNDREEFLNTDLTAQHLSWTDYRYWAGKQATAKDKVNDDPRVNRAIGILRGSMGAQLQALGIYDRKGNEDNYDHFTGALSSAIDVWTQEHGKAPSGTDVKDTIGPQVIQQTNRGRSLWHPFGDMEPFFTQDVTTKEAKDWMEQKKNDLMAAGGAEPTEQQLYQAYTRYQYLKLYKSKAPKSE